MKFHRVLGMLKPTIALLALLTTGCFKYSEPKVEEPHAVLTGEFLGGELTKDGHYAFGYWPMWSGCKGNKPKNECQVTKETSLDGRRMTLRLPVGEQMTINIYAIVDRKIENWGYGNQEKTTYCYGEPLVVTPKAGDRIEFAYQFSAQVGGCATQWKSGSTAQ